jgi:hypothetical protein
MIYFFVWLTNTSYEMRKNHNKARSSQKQRGKIIKDIVIFCYFKTIHVYGLHWNLKYIILLQ